MSKFPLSRLISFPRFATGLAVFSLIGGCAEEPTAPVSPTAAGLSQAPATSEGNSAKSVSSSDKAAAPGKEETFELKPLTLNNLSGNSGAAAGGSTGGSKQDSEKQIQSVISHLQPLQILLGQWRGTTRREFENFKAVDNHEWVWDLRTKPDQPALTLESDKSPYLKKGRLSWDVTEQRFTLTAVDAAGMERSYVGDFSEPVHEIVSSDDKLHKVFRLEFNQVETPETAGSELWQMAFAQQENNRYLLEIGRRRGNAAFARYDTVSTQREGTSFAVSDSGYADKTCIISEGLGTTELTYKGRSYWVCCSGCKAAFEDDPETWIARAAAKEKK